MTLIGGNQIDLFHLSFTLCYGLLHTRGSVMGGVAASMLLPSRSMAGFMVEMSASTYLTKWSLMVMPSSDAVTNICSSVGELCNQVRP